PVDGAQQDGDRLVLPYTKDVVKDAPGVDADQHLSPAEEEELYRYYKMNYDGTAARTDRDRTAAGTAAAGTAGTAGYAGTERDDRYATDTDRNAVPATGTTAGTAGTAGYAETERTEELDRDRTAGTADLDRDRTGVDDGSVVRHEEQLHVGKERRETGRARLRKYVVTDHETVDVPVEREEVRVERTPLSGTEATAGTIGEEDVEVTLHEERPVVAKETVGVEKVGLEKETVRDTERVEADVRKEQVDVENDADRGLTDRDRRDRI
ncbi:YsnF/AvaK domain-containing protein, partial [Kocuria flava]